MISVVCSVVFRNISFVQFLKMACGATLTLKRSCVDFELCRPAKRQRCSLTSSPLTGHTSTANTQIHKSVFADAVPRLTNDELASKIGVEIKRLQRRGRIGATSTHSASSADSGAHSPQPSSSMQSVVSQSSSTQMVATSSHCHDTPMLSLRQVQLVVGRLLKEHEDRLRDEYDKILNEKLTEQYEAFLKFNYDEISRRFGETAASYVS